MFINLLSNTQSFLFSFTHAKTKSEQYGTRKIIVECIKWLSFTTSYQSIDRNSHKDLAYFVFVPLPSQAKLSEYKERHIKGDSGREKNTFLHYTCII